MATHRREIRGKPHVCIVLKVTSLYPDGRPKTCEVGYDESVFNLEGGERFMTAWVPEQNVKKTSS